MAAEVTALLLIYASIGGGTALTIFVLIIMAHRAKVFTIPLWKAAMYAALWGAVWPYTLRRNWR